MTQCRSRGNKTHRFIILMFQHLSGDRIYSLQVYQFYAVTLSPRRQISKQCLELDHSRFLRLTYNSGEEKWGNPR